MATDAELLRMMKDAVRQHVEAEAAVDAALSMPNETRAEYEARHAALMAAQKLRARTDTAWRRLRKAAEGSERR